MSAIGHPSTAPEATTWTAFAPVAGCHSDAHRSQAILLAGLRISKNIDPVPSLMHSVETNCAGCHNALKHGSSHAVMTGSGETCAQCHTPEHPKMLDRWKKLLGSEVTFVEEVETEALEALAAAEGRLDAARLKEARDAIAAGQKLLNVVRVGNGVHNKKYSIMILDEALTAFEEAIDVLSSEN